MTILSDGSLQVLINNSTGLRNTQAGLRIDPWPGDLIQPSSVDLRLGSSFRTMVPPLCDPGLRTMNPLDAESMAAVAWRDTTVRDGEWTVIYPQSFMLATTMERVQLPDWLVGRVEGKSSLGRLGLLTHATAGYIDPGFRGQITLELYNLSPLPIRLTPDMRIAQISFHQLDTPALRPYGSPGLGSKYQDQSGATGSRYHLNDPV